ncbi:SDR family oxidoreductase [Geomonas nitrogeniifigens]|uniref:SDR family oxidoreductase n=1 Tax=Geomonas diazotrophica TaxID=2843197 RepID=A0ABX8JEQ2_9BACT|nr:SDR family oxidoreductase [Geomonas nitrogeniifigens]QWV95957.1 SDR family oxidoreductase [Geomonas nitrogeniifigens]
MNLDTLQVGRRDTVEMIVSAELIDAFAALSGDDNELHMSDAAARRYGFPQRVCHGVLSLAFISTLIGKKLPGAGALWRSLKVEWLRPVFPGDKVTITGEVTQVSASTSSIAMKIGAVNQNGTEVLQAEVAVGVGSELALSPQISPAAAAAAGPSAAMPATEEGGKAAVLVTGGSRGIGRAIALELARSGHPVAIAYHSAQAQAAEVVEEIEAAGGRAAAVRIDLGRSIDTAVLEQAQSVLGPLLGLVHAASPPLQNRPFDQLAPGDFEQYFRVYVCGAVELIQALHGNMKQHQFGRVVFLGTSAIIGTPPAKMAAYVTGKSAVLGLCKGLAVELGPSGVTVNMVSPGLTMTDLTRDYSPRMQLAEAQKSPMRRLATPMDTASMVRFLLSEEASFITGANLPLTGGAALL